LLIIYYMSYYCRVPSPVSNSSVIEHLLMLNAHIPPNT
jgi:hypothetical protein